MPAFKFKLAECVNVPSDAGVQGRVSGRTEFVGQPNIYQVVWLDAKLAIQSAVFSEADLIGLSTDAPTPLPDAEFATTPKTRKRSAKRKAKR